LSATRQLPVGLRNIGQWADGTLDAFPDTFEEFRRESNCSTTPSSRIDRFQADLDAMEQNNMLVSVQRLLLQPLRMNMRPSSQAHDSELAN